MLIVAEVACPSTGSGNESAQVHTGNIGTVGDQVVIIDWAYVGRGPIGHDVGHLALSIEPVGAFDPAEVWRDLTSAYLEALATAGWPGDLGVVERSIAVSNQLRLSWAIDTLLDAVELISDEDVAARSRLLTFLGALH